MAVLPLLTPSRLGPGLDKAWFAGDVSGSLRRRMAAKERTSD